MLKMASTSERRDFRFCIDRGGTFTDIYAEVPGEKNWRTLKLLSVDPLNYEDAPREGIRRILEEVLGVQINRSSKLPTDRIDWIRMGTTVATNALLERKGHKTALLVTKGFRDLLKIGNQARPDIFDLQVKLPSPLYEAVVEVEERVHLAELGEERQGAVEGVSGEWLRVAQPLQLAYLRPLLQGLLDGGVTSLAVAFMHSYTFPHHEKAVAALAQEMGFQQVSLSSDLTPMVRIVPRGHTAVVDAYLTPVIKHYLHTFMSGFDEGLSHVKLSFMQSDGGLTPAALFSGFRAILSGPAGGVVGYALTTHGEHGGMPVIGFDMGGTSTDVSRYAGTFEQVLETQTAGVTVQAPQLDIHTVAAGGGSRLHFSLGVFRVGPDSVGAHPGPVCYRKGGQLAVTDANLVLGRLIPGLFPHIFGPSEAEALDREGSLQAFAALTAEVNAQRQQQGGPAVRPLTQEEVALGFLRLANEEMCRAIRQLTEMKGHETSRHVLACFGGAGPQHACAMARTLRMGCVAVHRFSGLLSAFGMGLADVGAQAQEPCALVLAQDTWAHLEERLRVLSCRVQDSLGAQGFPASKIETRPFLNLRFQGTDTAIMTTGNSLADFLPNFLQQFQREYGFTLSGRPVVVDDIRVQGTGKTSILQHQEVPIASSPPQPEDLQHRCYFDSGWHSTPVYLLEKLGAGHSIPGPAIIMNGSSTIVVEPDCSASVTAKGNVLIRVGEAAPPSAAPAPAPAQGGEADVVQLSVFSNRFMGIAEQMGRTLQRTAISTNIKERLDFSCALFSGDGGLVANAPHVPVHLGAMASSVQGQLSHWGEDLNPGDVLLTNHPASGGSHLPDITVISPVFEGVGGGNRVVFLVASRGHHAEIGGTTPGSMPPFSKSLREEGAAVKAFKVVDRGVFQEEAVSALLRGSGPMPGTRNLGDNLADLRAQVAANQRGILLLQELIGEYTLPVVQQYMTLVQTNAEVAVRDMLRTVAREHSQLAGKAEDGTPVVLEARDWMDDGSCIQLALSIDPLKGDAHFDFSGTTPEVYGNWNAPRAVTTAAVIYCLRCLVAADIPLNQGCLAPIRLTLPPGSFLSPSDEAAVVGGNVLTSQRVTDVVLSAFSACACSQGCMNNLTFGDSTFGYYETIGGGCGAGPTWHGSSGVQCHMTNTRITDPEIMERRYPVVLEQFAIRSGSGGEGRFRGGDGLVREIRFKRPVTVSILSERRVLAPRGAHGGKDGARGINLLIKQNGRKLYLGGKNTFEAESGDVLLIQTPGGGAWG